MNIKETINSYLTYFGSQANVVLAYLGVSLALGFVVGFITKYYFKYLFWAILIAGASFYLAHYLYLININYSMVNTYIDLTRSVGLQYSNYVYNNISYLVAGVVGFIFAWIFA